MGLLATMWRNRNQGMDPRVKSEDDNRRLEHEKPKRYRGIALLVVMVSLMLMSSIVTDLSYNEIIKYKLAINERDALKAEALAASGLNFSRILMIAQDKVQGYINAMGAAGISMPAHSVADLIPVESDLIKSLTTGDLLSTLGMDVSESLAAGAGSEEKFGESLKFESKFRPPKGGFGAFDGTFSVLVQAEDGRISLRGWGNENSNTKRKDVYDLVYALMEPKRYDPLFIGKDVGRPALIGNIYDYITDNSQITDPLASADEWGRRGGGDKVSLYAKYDGVKPRSAYFDSTEEMWRLVHGMTDEHVRAFSSALTIYGMAGKVNITSASDQVKEAIVRYCATDKTDARLRTDSFMQELMTHWAERITLGKGAPTGDGFVAFLTQQGVKPDEARCKALLSDKQQNFTFKSSAKVGEVTRTLTLVARIATNNEELYYFSDV